MDALTTFLDFFLHIDRELAELAPVYGGWMYAILFLVVFCETGLVVTPFLPGDSLLFAAGALATKGAFDIHTLAILLLIAAIIGDAVNYHIGKMIGPKVFHNPNSKVFKKKYLDRTHAFYEKYGGKTIILARFVPIVRTFAPFLAGVGVMSYSRFFLYNAVGAVIWVGLFTYAGYYFGALPFVEKNFKLVILAIIVLSIMPIVIEYIKARKEAQTA